MPRWLYGAYRFTATLVAVMLVVAGASLVVATFLGFDSLWHWATFMVTKLRNLPICM